MKRTINSKKFLTFIAVVSLSAIGFKTISAALATPETGEITPVENSGENVVSRSCEQFWVLTKYADRLNVRNEPEGRAIASIDYASIVSLQRYSDDGEWALVSVESKKKNGVQGWVATDYLTCYE